MLARPRIFIYLFIYLKELKLKFLLNSVDFLGSENLSRILRPIGLSLRLMEGGVFFFFFFFLFLFLSIG